MNEKGVDVLLGASLDIDIDMIADYDQDIINLFIFTFPK